eukprot:5514816-Lingulodinium_polyedra.AAC.1
MADGTAADVKGKPREDDPWADITDDVQAQVAPARRPGCEPDAPRPKRPMVGAAGTAPAALPGAQGAVQRDAGWAMVKAAGMRA